MSGPEKPPEPGPTASLKRKRFCVDDQRELDQLDAVFKRMKKTIPPVPYILSTPSLHPYMHRTRFEAQAWIMGTLFAPDEDHLQYRTYLFREPYEDCFALQHGEDYAPVDTQPKTQAASVKDQVPKKKISLSDYASKQANGVITPGSKKLSPALLPVKPPAVSGTTNGVKPAEAKAPPSAQKPDDAKPQPRFLSEERRPQQRDERHTAKEPAKPSNPPPKATSAESKSHADKPGPSAMTPHGLPPLLSPVEQPLSKYGLPPILSPTLPPVVQSKLDELEAQRSRADSTTSVSSSDRKSQLLAVPDARAHGPEDGAKTALRERSSSLQSKSPAPADQPAETARPKTLVVKLKFSKRSRERLRRLLNLPSKRESSLERKEPKEAADHPPKTQTKTANNAPAKRPVPKIAARRAEQQSTPTLKTQPAAAARAAQKRARSDDDAAQAPSKRPRASTLQDGPNTPKDQLLNSPSLSTKSSAHKNALQNTPRKDLRALNMLRTTSAEGYDSTPGRPSATPLGTRTLDVKPPTSAPPSHKKQAEIARMQHTSKRLNQLGRSLKHEGQKLEHDKPRMAASRAARTTAALTALECILAYMAAFTAQDLALGLCGRPAQVDATWKTLLPLCVSYARLTKEFPALDGFRSLLGAVIAGGICALLAPRASNAKAHDSPLDGTGAGGEQARQRERERERERAVEGYAQLADHYRSFVRLAHEARVGLPMGALQRAFPRTWAGAATATAAAAAAAAAAASAGEGVAREKSLAGPYFLPVGADTTPIQAVRFGLRFLGEWCEGEGEGVGYRIRLDLEGGSE